MKKSSQTFTLLKFALGTVSVFTIVFLLAFSPIKSKQIPIYKNPKVSVEDRVNDLLSRMTIEEKAGQLNQLNGGTLTGPGSETNKEYKLKLVKEGKVGSFLNITGVGDTKLFQEAAVKESRLGIPLLFAMDVIHGYKTIFPIPLAEACSWDLKGIELNSSIAAKEAAAAGLHWTFAPMCDISNDPRWGRVMEGAGEDPYLSGLISAARVKGFQGNFDNKHILACIKHYAGYGAVEGGREYNTVDMSRVTLWNKHLPSYEAAVKAGAETVMNGFNIFEGVPVSANKYLVTDVLKNKWNFNGFIVSDWASFEEMIAHGYAKDSIDAAEKALNAGSMMDMTGEVVIKNLPALVKSGKVSEATVNDAVARILTTKFKLGLFDDPYKYNNEQREKDEIFNTKNRQLAKEAAERTLVLLKNNNQLLPLKNLQQKVALIGYYANSKKDMFDFWICKGDSNDAVTVKDGLQKIYPNLKYAAGYNDEAKPDQSLVNNAIALAKTSDVLVVNLGWSGKFSGEERAFTNINLPDDQINLLKELKKTGKPIVALISSGRPLVLTPIIDLCDAIVACWIPGTEAGNAIASVLSGSYNPSAKTVMSFPYSVGQIPVYYNRFSTGRPGIDYEGGPWSSRYRDVPNAALFPFGYGLSYTTFAYQNFRINSNNLGNNVSVSVDVKNTGKYDGEEIVQLYIHDKYSSIIRPIKELKGFKKIALKVGESQTVNFTLSKDDLSYRNENGDLFIEDGAMEIMVGGNSRDVEKLDFNFKN